MADGSAKLVVDEYDNGKLRLERVTTFNNVDCNRGF